MVTHTNYPIGLRENAVFLNREMRFQPTRQTVFSLRLDAI